MDHYSWKCEILYEVDHKCSYKLSMNVVYKLIITYEVMVSNFEVTCGITYRKSVFE
jgi:hypothetical protein